MVIRLLDERKHFVFGRRSLIWGIGESCTIAQGINSEPENV